MNLIDLILKEAHWINKISLLEEIQLKNMVGQLFAKNKDLLFLYKLDDPEKLNKEKEKYLNFAQEINNKVIKNLKVDFKNEKTILFWILEQVFRNIIEEERLNEDLNIIKENLEIYFKNKGKINKVLNNVNYKQLKEIVKDYKEGGEEVEHQEFLSKPLYKKDSYKIYKITEVEQCIKIGKGTSWCIQGENYAKKYLSKGPLFLVVKSDKRFALLSFETAQFMNINDNPLIKSELEEIFKVFPEEIFNKLFLRSLQVEGELIKLIENPNEELQLTAVKNSGEVIKLIKNPTEKVQLAAVENYAYSIIFIENPTEKIQLEAIKKFVKYIKYIKNPTDKVQIEAVSQNPYVISLIDNPCEEAQLIAVKHDIKNIDQIRGKLTKKVLNYMKNKKGK